MSAPLSVRDASRALGDALLAETGRIAWTEIAERVAERQRLLTTLVDPSDPEARVALVGAPTEQGIVDALAAIDLGVPLVLLHPRWTAAEREHVIRETAPRVVLDGTELRPGEHAHDVREPTDARPLAILYTSGTTGAPKGAVLSRRAFLASASASAANLPLGPRDRWLLCMPIAHVGGLSVVVRSLIARSAISLTGPFDVDRTLAAIERDRPTLVSLVPTMLARLLDAGWERPPDLRAVLLGGAGCPERLLRRAIERGFPIRTTYGLTEACSQVTTAREDLRSPSDGAGEPLPGTRVRIGARGTIEIAGPTLFDGYFPLGARPSPFDADGFYDTGDLGRFDERGRLHVLARRTDLIVSGGENVYPAEVESALERVDGVIASCVFGVDDDRWGQRVAAAIVTTDDAPDDARIVSSLRASLSGFKVPRAIARLPSLPTNGSGKLDRAATAALARPALVELASRSEER